MSQPQRENSHAASRSRNPSFDQRLSDFIVRLRREYSGDKDAEKIITTFEGLFSQDTLEKYMNRIHDVYKDLGRSPARPLKPTAQKDYYDEHTVRNLISQIESAESYRWLYRQLDLEFRKFLDRMKKDPTCPAAVHIQTICAKRNLRRKNPEQKFRAYLTWKAY
ncbi:MAG: hypothetical protein Q9194_002412 [Teloschistes cf. exilis]